MYICIYLAGRLRLSTAPRKSQVQDWVVTNGVVAEAPQFPYNELSWEHVGKVWQDTAQCGKMWLCICIYIYIYIYIYPEVPMVPLNGTGPIFK